MISMQRVLRATELVFVLLAFTQVRGAAGQQTLSGANSCTQAGSYTLCQNLWGADTGVGSQTSTLKSVNGNSVSWETKYTWANSPNNVKSYPNVGHNTAKGMQLQDIVSAPTQWSWDYASASDDLRADVSYDIWTGVGKSGDVASSASSYEIMIWLSDRGGVGGIGNVVASNLNLGGHQWTLKYGPNANWNVFSFITAEGDITNFNADLNDFFQYLINNQGVAKTQFLQAIQSGTEPFTGTADLVINNFSVDVSTQQDASTSTTPQQSSSTPTHTSATAFPSSDEPSASSTHGATSSSSHAKPSSHAASPTASDSHAGQTSTAAASSQSSRPGKCRLTNPSSSKLRRREKRLTSRSLH